MLKILPTLCGVLLIGTPFAAMAEIVCNSKTQVVNVIEAPLDDREPTSDADVAALRQLKAATETFNIVDTLSNGSRVKVLAPSQKEGGWAQIVFRHSRTRILTQGFVHRTRLFKVACDPNEDIAKLNDDEYFSPAPDEPRLNGLSSNHTK